MDDDPVWFLVSSAAAGLSALVAALGLWKRSRNAHWAFASWLGICVGLTAASTELFTEQDLRLPAAVALAFLTSIVWAVRGYVRREPG
jgi:hypothetical protein